MDLESIKYIIKGIPVTLEYTFISFFIGLLLGIFISFGKLSKNKLLNYFTAGYISIFRGTPLLVQLSIFYFVTPTLIGYKISVFEAGIIAFSLNSAAYISEIIRSGIGAIDKGQFESFNALNISKWDAMKDIILPQAIRNILPTLVNEIISLLKETAIISFFGVDDIMKRSEAMSVAKYNYFVPMMTAAVCYYVLVMILSRIGIWVEKYMKIV